MNRQQRRAYLRARKAPSDLPPRLGLGERLKMLESLVGMLFASHEALLDDLRKRGIIEVRTSSGLIVPGGEYARQTQVPTPGDHHVG